MGNTMLSFFVTMGDTMTGKYICKVCCSEAVAPARYNLGYHSCLKCGQVTAGKRKVFEWILALVVTAGVGVLLAFVIINLLLGCETWDESLWTEYNSCLTLQHIIEGVSND